MSKRLASELEDKNSITTSPDSTTTATPLSNSSAKDPNSTKANEPPAKKRSRSRLGCHRCKRLKVKCDELKPSCTLCEKSNKTCDYSLKLTWGGRPFKDEKKSNLGFGTITSFEMKYNPEKAKSKKSQMKKEPIPQTVLLTKPIIQQQKATRVSDAGSAPPAPNTIVSATATPLVDHITFNKIDFNDLADVPMQQTSQDQFQQVQMDDPFLPLDSDQTLPLSAISNPRGSLGLQQFDDFASAFKDLDTSNLIAKHFVTDFLLPEFFEENQLKLNTKPSAHHGIDSISEDSNTPPENQLVVNSSFHTYYTPNSSRVPPSSTYSSSSLASPHHNMGPTQKQIQRNTTSSIQEESSPTSSSTAAFSHYSTNSNRHLDIPDFQEIENLFNYDIDNFTTLPQQISPIPDLLLKNPRYREYYHQYIETFSKTLVPANAQSYTDNPFTCLLPRLSLSSDCDGLLSAIIAMAISQRYSRSDVDQSTFPTDLTSDLLSRALNDLYKRLTDPKETQSDHTLGLILVMTCFDIIRGSRFKWRAHYLGARKIVMSRGFLKAVCDQKRASSTSNSNKITDLDIENDQAVSFERGAESDLVFFFTRWFAYLDTFALLVSSSAIYVSSPSRNLIKWSGPKVTRAQRENLDDIDKLMGFDFKLLDFFAEIISLIDEREKNCRTPNNLTIELMQRALDVKARLLEYIATTDKERDEIEFSIKLNTNDPRHSKLFDYARIRATNNVFALAGVLQIYRRVLMMATESDIVQDVVNEITVIIQDKIPDNTTAANCTMFALFTSGCEAIDIDTRAFYIDRLNKLIGHGATGARDAYNIMLDSWETGKFWADILSEKNIDIMFS
ncbi:hypothetical protein WICPIJ_003000 [Wickerhamomyces pijperi]|uniref:Zn(2)-C6 fungal-type domain-containing protein n=1 Tax=Wickerhamomyces pijperi TaxID=599730 RepID=A0A9P8TPM0_WICPI|nr:hypothetical protein WICPIJ_003000 [Wickerhamomyces pijperi]